MPTTTAQEASSIVAAFRAPHPIEPEYPRGTRETHNWCRTCGVDVYPVKNGWRHDTAVVVRLRAAS
jgi:hypothetical protein